jgi:hypothetical protein
MRLGGVGTLALTPVRTPDGVLAVGDEGFGESVVEALARVEGGMEGGQEPGEDSEGDPGGVGVAAEEGVEGEPVALAELFQGFLGLGVIGVFGSCGVDERPLGGIELAWGWGG